MLCLGIESSYHRFLSEFYFTPSHFIRWFVGVEKILDILPDASHCKLAINNIVLKLFSFPLSHYQSQLFEKSRESVNRYFPQDNYFFYVVLIDLKKVSVINIIESHALSIERATPERPRLLPRRVEEVLTFGVLLAFGTCL